MGEGDDRGWDGWMDHWLNGHEFEQAMDVGDGQGSLVCWLHRVPESLSDWTELNVLKISIKSNFPNTSSRISVALLIFCLGDLSTDVSEVLVSSIIIFRFISPFSLLVFVFYISVQFSCAVLSDSLWPHWTSACQASPSITNSWSLLKLMSIKSWCQPSYPLSSPSPPTFKLSQHQGLLQWVSSLHQVAKVLEPQLQHQSFQWIVRRYLL